MKRRGTPIAVTISLALLGTAMSATAQTLKQQLVGPWTFVSSTTKLLDGSPLWGDDPKGLTIFTENGRFVDIIMRSDRSKFASNNRTQGTPEENKASAQGTISVFGTYTVDEANKTYSVRIEGSSYPNLEGTVQTRPFTISGDEFRFTNPAPTNGQPVSQLVFKRAK
jgi:hypothetical protein